jgi:hypothetical protein
MVRSSGADAQMIVDHVDRRRSDAVTVGDARRAVRRHGDRRGSPGPIRLDAERAPGARPDSVGRRPGRPRVDGGGPRFGCGARSRVPRRESRGRSLLLVCDGRLGVALSQRRFGSDRRRFGRALRRVAFRVRPRHARRRHRGRSQSSEHGHGTRSAAAGGADLQPLRRPGRVRRRDALHSQLRLRSGARARARVPNCRPG